MLNKQQTIMARTHLPPTSGVEAALNQAKRARRRGNHRQEMLLLRKAAFQGGQSPALWNRYALSCMREGRVDEAEKAFAQSVYLDKRQGNHRRAEVTLALAERARHGNIRYH